MSERTLSILKPDAVRKNVTGAVNQRFEAAGLKIIAQKMVKMSRPQAEEFYAEHKERPFFGELVDFMTSGPVVLQILEGENAITKNRELLGATNPDNAEPGTIRHDFARPVEDLSENIAHGSDSPESAARETSFFFSEDEIVR